MGKKSKVPKKIAGVKIPKVLRKNSLIKGLLGSQAGRQILADALMAAAGAAATALVAARSSAPAKTGEAIAQAGEDGTKVARRALKSAAGALTDVLSKAAKSAFGQDDTRTKQQRSTRAH